MPTLAPPWLPHRDRLDDAVRYAAMTPEERLAVFVDVCELARTSLEPRPDRAEVLAAVGPMARAAEQAWIRLVREARRGRTARLVDTVAALVDALERAEDADLHGAL